MFVTACAERFEEEVHTMLRSLRRRGRIPADRITVMVYGGAEARRGMLARLHRELPGVRCWAIDPSSAAFDFMRRDVQTERWVEFPEYLKAHAASRLRRYVWVEADVLATSDLRSLEWILRDCADVMMAANPGVAPQLPARHPARAEGRLFTALLARAYPGARPWTDEHGAPLVLSPGVLVVARDYRRVFRHLYRWLRPLFDSAAGRRQLGVPAVPVPWLGLGLWNIIGWMRASALLPSEFGAFAPRSSTALEHFLGYHRPDFARRALELAVG